MKATASPDRLRRVPSQPSTLRGLRATEAARIIYRDGGPLDVLIDVLKLGEVIELVTAA